MDVKAILEKILQQITQTKSPVTQHCTYDLQMLYKSLINLYTPLDINDQDIDNNQYNEREDSYSNQSRVTNTNNETKISSSLSNSDRKNTYINENYERFKQGGTKPSIPISKKASQSGGIKVNFIKNNKFINSPANSNTGSNTPLTKNEIYTKKSLTPNRVSEDFKGKHSYFYSKRNKI